MNKWTILLILLTATLVKGKNPMGLSELIPGEMRGWQAKDKDKIYTRTTLFRYMNGGAELYLSYDFRELLVRRFVKPDEPDVIAELYHMGSSEDAFGVFALDREGNEIGIGQGSEFGAGWLRFWKGNFFVSIFAEGETPEASSTVLEIGKALATAIKSTGVVPELLAYLPKDGLIEKSIRYFHRHEILNYHYFLANQNILKLDKRTAAILAQYQFAKDAFQGQPESNATEPGHAKSYLLLVRYPSARQAQIAFDSFMNTYMPEAKQTGLVQTEDGKWTAGVVEQRLVIVVFGALTQNWAKKMIEAVREKLVMPIN